MQKEETRYYFRFNVLTEQTEYAERTIYAEQPEGKRTELSKSADAASRLAYIYRREV